jgi:hypothetical protein
MYVAGNSRGQHDVPGTVLEIVGPNGLSIDQEKDTTGPL